jgi:hypothetical protein
VPFPVASKIMVIRHAEKPNSLDGGVSPTGVRDKTSLSVKGWQRAGALGVLFSPPGIAGQPALAVPRFLFASVVSSQRPVQTIVPLSRKLNLSITGGRRGEEKKLVEQASSCDGPVLISWQREQIPELAKLLLKGSPDEGKHPTFWPQDRFDLTWVFELQSGIYRFQQIPQCLLAGDSDSPIQKL